MTNFQELINNSIKELRNKTGLSQEKFSEKCGISTDNYRNLEHNRYTPKAKTIDKICSAFNITVVELLQITNNTSSAKDNVITALGGLTEAQLNLVEDFIKTIRTRNF
ncbi:helix-turn-helix transcriptional regulator [bacterium]|nr:helix-turn-helix transcriptional regulator [bacterium]